MDMEQQDFLSRMDRTTPNSYFHQQHQEQMTRETATAAAAANHQSSTSSLLGVRKTQTKLSKRSTIDPPVPPKVYRVEPRGFRQLVQSLTGSSASRTTTTTTTTQPTATTATVASSNNSLRLRDAAPAPLHFDLNHQQRTSMASFEGVNANSVPFSKSPVPLVEGGQMSPIGGLFSPTSLFSAYMAWSSHPVLSPRTMASVDQSNPL